MKNYFGSRAFLTNPWFWLFIILTLFLLVHAPFRTAIADNANWEKPSDEPETPGDKHERLAHVFDYLRTESMSMSSHLPDTLRESADWAVNEYHAAEESIGMQIRPSYSHGFLMHSEMKFDDSLSLNATVHDSDASQSGNSLMLRWKLLELSGGGN